MHTNKLGQTNFDAEGRDINSLCLVGLTRNMGQSPT